MTGGQAAPAREASPRGRALDRELIHGIAWTGAARWLTQILSWASTFVVARLLTQVDYGLVGMATLFLGAAQLVNEFGIGTAVVQLQDLDEEDRAGLGGFSITLGLLFFLLCVVAAHWVAAFFGQPAVRDVTIVMGTTFAIGGFKVLPSGLLSRELQFARLARIDAASALLQTVVTLATAIAGFRYWSLVAGSVTGMLLLTGMTMWARPHRVAWPRSPRRLMSALTLGWQVTVSRVMWYVYSNADFGVVGRILGPGPLGAYSLGWQVASVPVEKITAVVARVTQPVMSAVQKDAAALRRYVCGLTEGLALLAFPASAGMALVARNFVLVALGPKWAAAIVPLQLLCLYAGFRSITVIIPQVLVAIGEARQNMWVSVLMAVVLPVLFVLGTRWGTGGVAAVWVVVYPLIAIPSMIVFTLRRLDLRAGDYLRALWPALSSTLVMSLLVLAVERAVPPSLGPLPGLLIQIGAGVAAYVLAIVGAHRARVREIRVLIAGMRHQG